MSGTTIIAQEFKPLRLDTIILYNPFIMLCLGSILLQTDCVISELEKGQFYKGIIGK